MAPTVVHPDTVDDPAHRHSDFLLKGHPLGRNDALDSSDQQSSSRVKGCLFPQCVHALHLSNNAFLAASFSASVCFGFPRRRAERFLAEGVVVASLPVLALGAGGGVDFFISALSSANAAVVCFMKVRNSSSRFVCDSVMFATNPSTSSTTSSMAFAAPIPTSREVRVLPSFIALAYSSLTNSFKLSHVCFAAGCCFHSHTAGLNSSHLANCSNRKSRRWLRQEVMLARSRAFIAFSTLRK